MKKKRKYQTYQAVSYLLRKEHLTVRKLDIAHKEILGKGKNATTLKAFRNILMFSPILSRVQSPERLFRYLKAQLHT